MDIWARLWEHVLQVGAFNILIAVKTKWQQQKIKTHCSRQQKQTSDFTRVITAIPNSVFTVATHLFIILARMYFYALVSYHVQAFWLSIVQHIAPKPNVLQQQLFHYVLWSLTFWEGDQDKLKR